MRRVDAGSVFYFTHRMRPKQVLECSHRFYQAEVNEHKRFIYITILLFTVVENGRFPGWTPRLDRITILRISFEYRYGLGKYKYKKACLGSINLTTFRISVG
jgi:hypothetical protein